MLLSGVSMKMILKKEPFCCKQLQQQHDIVETIASSTMLSGHPVLSGRFSESRAFFPLITVIVTFIKRSW